MVWSDRNHDPSSDRALIARDRPAAGPRSIPVPEPLVMAEMSRNATLDPSGRERLLDLVHLARMTRGDCRLEREVLELFDRQATMLIGRMRSGAPPAVVAAAHVLTGSARGIGAWAVARAAQAVEEAAAGGAAGLSAALERLAMAVGATRSVIIELFGAN